MEILKVIVDKVPERCADCEYCKRPEDWIKNFDSRAKCLLGLGIMSYVNTVSGRLHDCPLVEKGVDDGNKDTEIHC